MGSIPIGATIILVGWLSGRAHGSHPWGHWFESSTDHHIVNETEPPNAALFALLMDQDLDRR